APLWSHPGGGSSGPPAVANGVVYTGGDHLYAFDAQSGASLASLPLPPSSPCCFSSPIVSGGVVYARDADRVQAYGLPEAGPLLSATTERGAFYPFGDVLDGTESFPVTIMVQNHGHAATSALTPSVTGADPTEAHIATDGCTGRQLAPGAACD